MVALNVSRAAAPEDVAARMQEACGELSFSEIARRTGSNRETVRRYMTQGKPTVAFVAAICEHFGISPTWLILGRGPKFDHTLAERAAPRSKHDGRGSPGLRRRPSRVER